MLERREIEEEVMKIEEKIREIVESMRDFILANHTCAPDRKGVDIITDEGFDKAISFYTRDLTNLFKFYARSLIPESCPDEVLLEVRRHQGWSNDEIVLYVWRKCRKEILRKIEESSYLMSFSVRD